MHKTYRGSQLKSLRKHRTEKEFGQICFDIMCQAIINHFTFPNHSFCGMEACLRPLFSETKAKSIYWSYARFEDITRLDPSGTDHFSGNKKMIRFLAERFDFFNGHHMNEEVKTKMMMEQIVNVSERWELVLPPCVVNFMLMA